MEPAIQIKNLSVTLGGAVALNNVSFDLPRGRITGLIGPSGSGKTTLLRSIVGLIKPAEGSVVVFGKPAGTAQLRRQVSYMNQELSVYPDLTVAENLRYFTSMAGIKRSHHRVLLAKLLETVSMADKADTLVGHLSSGQKQRVSLAVAMIGNPKLMVLDEPTVGLDPVLRSQIWKLFVRLAGSGTTLLVSSHVMDEASRCQDLILLRDGMLLSHATPQQLCQRTRTSTVEQAFIRMAGAS